MTTQQLRGAIVSRLADLFRILRERQRQPELGSNQAENPLFQRGPSNFELGSSIVLIISIAFGCVEYFVVIFGNRLVVIFGNRRKDGDAAVCFLLAHDFHLDPERIDFTAKIEFANDFREFFFDGVLLLTHDP